MSLTKIISELQSANIWSDPKKLKRGAYLSSAGEVNQKVYWVEQGTLHFYLLKDGEEQSIRFAYPGNVVSVLDSYISAKPSVYYLQALREVQYRECSKSDFDAFLKDSDLIELWNLSLHQLILEMMEREQDLLEKSPALRLQRVMERSPRLFQEVPFKYIASYLRMSPETLSRLLNS